MRWDAIRTIGTLAALATALACSHRPPVAVPGATDTGVEAVRIVAADGTELAVDYAILYESLGLRVGSLIRPERPFNPFRLAEDRRRVQTHAQLAGHFEATVAEPTIEKVGDKVAVTFTVDEGPAYRIRAVEVRHAPDGTEAMLRGMLRFGPGDLPALSEHRPIRRALAERLQAEGYGHARVFFRAYVDRGAKEVTYHYFVDAGPRTVVKSLVVAGNNRVPAERILERIELEVGGPYDLKVKKRSELALLDSGGFRSVVVRHNADILTGPPQWPDTGGALTAAQIDDQGDLVPRELDPGIDVRIVVVEAPARQVRLEAGTEADPARIDLFAGGRAIARHVLGTNHHLVLEGRVGRGWRFGEDDPGNPEGLYGEALARYVRAGLGSPRLDGRLSARLRQTLFPDATVRDIAVGPGLRAVPAAGLFLDLDVVYLRAEELGLAAVDPAVRMDLSLSDDPVSSGAAALASAIYDRRNDRIEPTTGHFLAARAELSPGGALSTHRSLRLEADARRFTRLTDAWSLAIRGSGAWVGLDDDAGVPLGSRLFGGGSYGFRGHGRQKLATRAPCSDATECDEIIVGGLSRVEGSVEARLLPFRALYGAAVFVDVGAVGPGSNPFEDGVSAAIGLGARLRSWYVPVAFDVAYRALDESELVGPTKLSRFTLFARVGEAF